MSEVRKGLNQYDSSAQGKGNLGGSGMYHDFVAHSLVPNLVGKKNFQPTLDALYNKDISTISPEKLLRGRTGPYTPQRVKEVFYENPLPVPITLNGERLSGVYEEGIRPSKLAEVYSPDNTSQEIKDRFRRQRELINSGSSPYVDMMQTANAQNGNKPTVLNYARKRVINNPSMARILENIDKRAFDDGDAIDTVERSIYQ
jgi:hypothetical protein